MTYTKQYCNTFKIRKMTIWFPFGGKQGFNNTNVCSHVGVYTAIIKGDNNVSIIDWNFTKNVLYLFVLMLYVQAI
jgi:hypothetical protein